MMHWLENSRGLCFTQGLERRPRADSQNPYGDSRNESFSKKTIAQPRADEVLMNETPDITYYLVNVKGTLIVRRKENEQPVDGIEDYPLYTGLYGAGPAKPTDYMNDDITPVNDNDPIAVPKPGPINSGWIKRPPPNGTRIPRVWDLNDRREHPGSAGRADDSKNIRERDPVWK